MAEWRSRQIRGGDGSPLFVGYLERLRAGPSRALSSLDTESQRVVCFGDRDEVVGGAAKRRDELRSYTT